MTDDARNLPQQGMEFHFIKSNFFRVIYAEGVYGGVTPRGMITFAMFNERSAIPQQTTADVSADGRLTDERIVAARSGLVREVEVEVIMDLAHATEFHRWLGGKIEFLRKALGEDHGSGG